MSTPEVPSDGRPLVITVRGPIDAARLGVTDAHDHLFLCSPALAGQELVDVDAAIDEVSGARSGGLSTIIEATPIGLGRRPDLMRRVAEVTGVNIVAATGYHRDAHYPHGHWVLEADEQMLFERIATDIGRGMHAADWLDPTLPLDSARAGIIKVGASYHHVSGNEGRRLAAAAQASMHSGVAILAHTEVGTAADQIADLLAREGVAPERLVLAHLDRNPDFEIHADLASRGTFLEYDTVGRIKYRPDSVLLDLIEQLVGVGLGAQILLGLDLGRRDYYHSHGGGPGMRYLMDKFVPRLERRIGAEGVHTILVDNAARAFAIRGVS